MWTAPSPSTASPTAPSTMPDAPSTTASTTASATTSSVWTYDVEAFPPPSASEAAPSTNHTRPSASSTLWTHPQGNGVIGASYIHNRVSKSRLLWNRTAPEEEEREEEALPSYLSYLQPTFRGDRIAEIMGTGPLPSTTSGSASTPSPWEDGPSSNRRGSGRAVSPPPMIMTSTGSSLSATASPFRAMATPTHLASPSTASPPAGFAGVAVETKTKELALALQEFVRQQVDQQQRVQLQQQMNSPSGRRGSVSTPPLPPGEHDHAACQCEPLRLRVSDLEQKLMTLQQQVSSMLSSMPPHAHPMPLPPPLPPMPATPPSMVQPPLPPAPPQAPGVVNPSVVGGLPGGVAAPGTNPSGINDRVSTLEGRQSAFQSQLAQISKVLGVPVGKHGKNSQIKNLVQTLRDEIDVKLTTATKEIETQCLTTVQQELASVVETTVKDFVRTVELPTSSSSGSFSSSTTTASSSSTLSYDAVLGALAEEHEASLAKLSSYFEERLVQESKQRVGLENRLQTRLGEHEEWLQQLEGEFGSWHDTSSSVATQLRLLQSKVHELDETWKAEQLKTSKGATEPTSTSPSSTKRPNGSALSNSAGNGHHPSVNPSSEALTRTVHQVQTQLKQFLSEYKNETSELRENLALMDTWVKTTRQETRDLGKNVKGMKQLLEKLVRDTGSAEELLQQYVSTITHQVASVTRQYVSVRIRDNNRLIDATLRARVPAYVENESESFMLVRPEKKVDPKSAITSGTTEASVVLKDDDEDGIRRLLRQHAAGEAAMGMTPSSSTPLLPQES
ncbi:hypothetical protein Poli38472_010798 [Pythium oligandrum]|uniref:Uncharacterized protein n=1 Tax=Pythium oligandrum TaxID=41045 RepID=A0A8K1CEI6_PYTOL|nr:hypothetical protein Poli38472_010798 [Pythium oligandrum]|eukprot:TMW61735.1 hypothetical protein Poli38472_010798 [Pythium oligandrum]